MLSKLFSRAAVNILQAIEIPRYARDVKRCRAVGCGECERALHGAPGRSRLVGAASRGAVDCNYRGRGGARRTCVTLDEDRGCSSMKFTCPERSGEPFSYEFIYPAHFVSLKAAQ